MASATKTGGYPLRILKQQVELMHQKFICVKCKQLLKNPFQGFCGHRYCRSCLYSIESGDHCPFCEEEGITDEDSILGPDKTFPDNAIKREMNLLQVKCVEDECPWEGNFKDLEAHISECAFIPVICNQCHSKVPRNKMEAHMISKCGTIDLDAYRCPYGCEDTIADQSSLEKHENERISQHLRKLFEDMKDIGSKFNSLKFQDQSSAQEASTSQRLDDQASAPADSSIDLLRIVNVEKAVVVLSKDLSSICDKISDLERQHYIINEELKKTQSLERNILKCEALLNELQTKVDFLENTSYDGFMVWRLNGFSKHREDAVNNRITSTYSPPFYTSRTGYKLCLRLYLNGDGMGKGTHISLFFVVMKGPYDAILSWPFDIPVRFELMDVSGGKDGAVDTFKPDPSSNSFKRPTTSMNIASGCPTFVKLSDFEVKKSRYVHEDAVFIKVEVNPLVLNSEK